MLPKFMTYPVHHLQRSEEINSKIPKQIWRMPNPPKELFVQGTESALEIFHSIPQNGLAIVGTRNPQPRSIACVRKCVLELAGSNRIIVSGLARGIDAVAHSAALEAGLPTVAVLGAGLDLNYPRENFELRMRILKAGGLIVSEFPQGTPALGHHFLMRNRVIASWSQATWVVEAACRSGALSTAKWAREQDRTCFAVPCYPGDPALSGNQMLLDRDHALAFWGVHSLGAVWLELAARVSQPKLRSSGQDKSVKELTQQVHVLTCQRGSASLQDLLDWALGEGWDSQLFFVSLRAALQSKVIIEDRGAYLSTES
jgi:DNA protecting protein DprA